MQYQNTNITLCYKNDTDVADYNFSARQLTLVIFGRDFAKTLCCRMVGVFIDRMENVHFTLVLSA